MIKVYESFDEELKSVWRELESAEHVLAFQTLAWCSSCARPFVIVWTGDKGESPVLLPTRLTESGDLRFIGDGFSDAGDALYARGVNKNRAFAEIAAYIRGERRIRSVTLQKMRGESEALAYLGVMLKGSLVYRDHKYSWIDLPGGDFLSGQEQLRAHDRDKIKALLRKAESSTLETVDAARGRPFPRERIVALRDWMVGEGKRRRDFLSDEKLAFVERAYSAGLLEVVALREGESDLALSFQLRKGGRNHCWVILSREPAANTLQRVRYFSELAAQDWRGTVDFGVGVYDYKMETFRPRTGCTFSLRWGRGPLRSVYAVARMLWRFWRQRGA